MSRYLSGKVLADSILPTTVLRIREAVHAYFAYAKRLGYIRENPVSPALWRRLAAGATMDCPQRRRESD